MFKKLINSLLGVIFIMTATISFGDMFSSGNSLLFFGEPEYPMQE